MSITEDTRAAFASDGCLGTRFGEGYRPRDGQVRGASAVASVLEGGGRLILDAGTGTGKTLAYLVPCAIAARDALSDGMRRRTLVLVTTNALLHQIIQKDGPVIEDCFNVRVRGLQGVENYLCEERVQKNAGSFPVWMSDAQVARAREIEDWGRETGTGLRSELPFDAPSVWGRYSTTSGGCRGTTCPQAQVCHYLRAKSGAETAEIVVSTYALALTVLGRTGSSTWIDGFDVLVCDESHHLAAEARHHLGWEVSPALVRRAARGARSRELACAEVERAIHATGQGRIRLPGGLDASGARAALSLCTDELSSGLGDQSPDERIITRSRIRDLEEIADHLSATEEVRPGYAYWRERDAIHAAVLRPGRRLHRLLWSRFPAVVLTSATISTGGADPYGFVCRETGVPTEGLAVCRVPSPFDHSRVVAYVPPRSFPRTNDPGWERAATREVVGLVGMVAGRALVLCTSLRMVRIFGAALRAAGVGVGVQGGSRNKSDLIRDFQTGVIRVLVGSESLATGLDVPGLDLVVIDKLPFPRPNDPIVEALGEGFTDQGAFFGSYRLPVTIGAWLQRFGRLLRRESDRGVVATLDTRIVDAQYAGRFRTAKPPCRLYRNPRELKQAWLALKNM